MSLKSAATIKVGDELPPKVKPIAQRQIDCYSGVRPKSIHTDAEWAKTALRSLRQASPLSVQCALAAIRRGREAKQVWEALAVEYRFVSRAVQQGDFAEGIRAAVIDKDRTPKWTHPSLRDVKTDEVAAMLASLGDHELSGRVTNAP